MLNCHGKRDEISKRNVKHANKNRKYTTNIKPPKDKTSNYLVCSSNFNAVFLFAGTMIILIGY